MTRIGPPFRVCHLSEATVETPFFRYIPLLHDRERFPVVMGSLRPEGPFQEAMRGLGVPSFGIGTTARWQYPAALLAIVRRVRRERSDLVHAHGFDATALGLAAARLCRLPFVFTRHHSDHHTRIGARWHTRIDSWCARHADHVIAVSEATRRILVDVEGVPAEQITVVYNGVAPLPVSAPDRIARLREELGLGTAQACLMVGRLHEEKGHRFLLGAWPEVRRRCGPVVLLLAGTGPEKAALEETVRATGLTDCVRLLGWRDDVADLISVASLVVLPSLAESFGQAATEAMALGRPVVASTAGGLPELVKDGETGLLVPPGDVAALGEALCRVLSDPARARALGEAGPARAALFSYDRMLRGYEAVYERVLEAARS